QYTGGTTGIPKGAMLSHANLTINVQQIIAWSNILELQVERVMGILPFFHVFAMTTVLNFSIKTGSMMILMPKFELDQAIKLIRQHKPTILPGVPTLYTALLNHKAIKREHLASLKLCISGGAALPQEVRRRFEEFSGCKLVEGYGLSETSPVATVNPITGLEKAASIGQPVPRTYISIRSLEDPAKQMPKGESGEICIKGPQLMQGYWNNSSATKAVMQGGYFRTGDVGYTDEFGFTYIIDRIKDMINCSGYKVYPRRIEDAIYDHDAVAEVTVIGIPDDYRGEAPKAFIKLKEGCTATADEMLAHLKPKLSKIEMPEEIEFRDELPKTLVGKLSKKELREQMD
ncbi:MAG: AMP-binding protein, partial [Aestuariivirgaceae bacterium]